MSTIICIPSPPFGQYFWEKVCERIAQSNRMTKIVTPFVECGNLEEAIQFLKNEIIQINDDVVILTHGSTLNLGLELSKNKAVKGIVLTNGSISKPSHIAQIGLKTPKWLLNIMSQPDLATAIFSSSVGMRRWVVNPYVMNRDMVVMVCKEYLESETYRKNCINWIASHSLPISSAPCFETPILSIWGTHDTFHPLHERQKIENISPKHDAIEVPGGRYLHPLERPWETADAVLNWLNKRSL